MLAHGELGLSPLLKLSKQIPLTAKIPAIFLTAKAGIGYRLNQL
jgi:hypothetical protein